MRMHISEIISIPQDHPLREILVQTEDISQLPVLLDKCVDELKKQQIDGERHVSVQIEGPVVTGPGCRLSENVTIQGPAYIGPNVFIGAHAHIRPGTWIGAGASVGAGSEVKRAICLDKSKIASGAFVGDSILGFGVRIGSGTIFANRRFDQRDVTFNIKDDAGEIRRYLTDQQFFGSILGDFVRTGANVVLCPGTIVGAYTWIGPGVVLRGTHPGAQMIMQRQDLEVREIGRCQLRDAAFGS